MTYIDGRKETNLIPGRFWGIFFTIMTIGFVAYTYFVIKGTLSRSMRLIGVINFLSLPFFLIMMLNEHLTMMEKIINSIIAFVCVISATVYIYVLRKKRPPNKGG